jgi:hypothetical protein
MRIGSLHRDVFPTRKFDRIKGQRSQTSGANYLRHRPKKRYVSYTITILRITFIKGRAFLINLLTNRARSFATLVRKPGSWKTAASSLVTVFVKQEMPFAPRSLALSRVPMRELYANI